MKVRRAATLDDAKRRCREMIRPGEMGGNPSIEDESIRVVLEALAGAEQTLVLRDLDRRFANDVCEAMRKHFPEHQASAVELIEKMAAESADLRARLERAEAAAESLTGVVRLAMKAVEARDCALTCSCGECEQCTALAITAGDLDRMATGVQPPPGYVPASEVRRAVEEAVAKERDVLAIADRAIHAAQVCIRENLPSFKGDLDLLASAAATIRARSRSQGKE